MSGYAGYETQFKIVSPQGVTVYVGNAFVGVQHAYKSADTVTQYAGEPLNIASTSVLSGPNVSAALTDSLLLIKTPDASTITGVIGVALGNVAAGQNGQAAGHGSIIQVRCTTTQAVGTLCVAAAQASQGGTTYAVVKSAAAPVAGTVGLTLGTCIKTGTLVNSQYTCGVLVNPA